MHQLFSMLPLKIQLTITLKILCALLIFVNSFSSQVIDSSCHDSAECLNLNIHSPSELFAACFRMKMKVTWVT